MSGYRTTSVSATRDFGAALAGLVRSGDLLLLTGDLGSGKTAFTQGFARGLGIDEAITSPTFTLANVYKGDLVLNHLDVYRLERVQEAEDLGIGELLDDGVTVIEWGDAIAATLPADYLVVQFAYGDGDDDRRIELRVVGPGWSARQRALETALEAWAC